tara:strand:+ start:298 stop:399 length:102 start_codon:yes stop_codon:yes gene_type:complete
MVKNGFAQDPDLPENVDDLDSLYSGLAEYMKEN